MQQTYSKTKSKLPIPITRCKIATNETVTLSKLENENNNKQKRRKSNLFSSTCSRRAQEDKNYNKRLPTNNVHSFSFSVMHHTKKSANSPITLLKENLEQLKNKNTQDRLVIKAQEEEIKKLKRLVATSLANRQENIQLELSKKSEMQDKMKILTLQIEELKIQVINSLQIREKAESIEPFGQQIQALEIELESRQIKFDKQIKEQKAKLKEKDKSIRDQQTMISQTKKQHVSHLSHIQQTHRLHIHQLQSQHQKELDSIRHSIHSIDLEELISKALVDFEQEQHNHIPSKPFVFDSQQIRKQMNYGIRNQQWYSKKYMPVDAATWPAPFPLSHLRKPSLQQIG